MIKEVVCHDCKKTVELELPSSFEGSPLDTYEKIRSYVSFREICRNDYSLGKFVWDKDGNEAWLCPECNAKSIWLAGVTVEEVA